MKQRVVLLVCAILLAVLFGCGRGSAGGESGMLADDAEREETVPMEMLPKEPGYAAFSGYLRGSRRAEKGYDGDAFAQSEAAEKIYRDLYYWATYGLSRQEEPAIYAYWESLGLKKTVHDGDDPDRMWSLFVPSREQFRSTEKFPLVFCLHGNDNDILLAETYGFAKLGGQEGFITVVPWAKNEDIIVEEIPRILDALREERVPLDESRIYVTGFSKGGMAAQTVALAYSELFAAAAPGGCGPLGVSETAEPIRSGILQWSFPAEAFEQAYQMPVMFFGGSCDSMPVDNPAVQQWLRLSGAKAPEMGEDWFAGGSAASDDPVERLTGLRVSEDSLSEQRSYDGQNYYVLSYRDSAGVCTFRAVSVEGAPHWLMPSEAKVVWEFLSGFARNPESHEVICLGQD